MPDESVRVDVGANRRYTLSLVDKKQAYILHDVSDGKTQIAKFNINQTLELIGDGTNTKVDIPTNVASENETIWPKIRLNTQHNDSIVINGAFTREVGPVPVTTPVPPAREVTMANEQQAQETQDQLAQATPTPAPVNIEAAQATINMATAKLNAIIGQLPAGQNQGGRRQGSPRETLIDLKDEASQIVKDGKIDEAALNTFRNDLSDAIDRFKARATNEQTPAQLKTRAAALTGALSEIEQGVNATFGQPKASEHPEVDAQAHALQIINGMQRARPQFLNQNQPLKNALGAAKDAATKMVQADGTVVDEEVKKFHKSLNIAIDYLEKDAPTKNEMTDRAADRLEKLKLDTNHASPKLHELKELVDPAHYPDLQQGGGPAGPGNAPRRRGQGQGQGGRPGQGGGQGGLGRGGQKKGGRGGPNQVQPDIGIDFEE